MVGDVFRLRRHVIVFIGRRWAKVGLQTNVNGGWVVDDGHIAISMLACLLSEMRIFDVDTNIDVDVDVDAARAGRRMVVGPTVLGRVRHLCSPDAWLWSFSLVNFTE
jgi:hypothetical protein